MVRRVADPAAALGVSPPCRSRAGGDAAQYAEEVVGNVRTVRAFGAEEIEIAPTEEKAEVLEVATEVEEVVEVVEVAPKEKEKEIIAITLVPKKIQKSYGSFLS